MVNEVIKLVAGYIHPLPAIMQAIVMMASLFVAGMLLFVGILLRHSEVRIDEDSTGALFSSFFQAMMIGLTATCAGVYAYDLGHGAPASNVIGLIVVIGLMLAIEILSFVANRIYQPFYEWRCAETMQRYHEKNPPPSPGYHDWDPDGRKPWER